MEWEFIRPPIRTYIYYFRQVLGIIEPVINLTTGKHLKEIKRWPPQALRLLNLITTTVIRIGYGIESGVEEQKIAQYKNDIATNPPDEIKAWKSEIADNIEDAIEALYGGPGSQYKAYKAQNKQKKEALKAKASDYDIETPQE
mgnify:CR=1 FL=1